VVKTLQSIKKGIAMLDERRAAIEADDSGASTDGTADRWDEAAERSTPGR